MEKSLEKPLIPMVDTWKTIDIPLCPKIYHRYGLLPSLLSAAANFTKFQDHSYLSMPCQVMDDFETSLAFAARMSFVPTASPDVFLHKSPCNCDHIKLAWSMIMFWASNIQKIIKSYDKLFLDSRERTIHSPAFQYVLIEYPQWQHDLSSAQRSHPVPPMVLHPSKMAFLAPLVAL